MTDDEIELVRFDYNVAPSEEDLAGVSLIKSRGKQLAQIILERCPASADRSAAIRDLRVSIMQAVASIAFKDLK